LSQQGVVAACQIDFFIALNHCPEISGRNYDYAADAVSTADSSFLHPEILLEFTRN